MRAFLLVCLGGAAGSGARYLLAGWLDRAGTAGFPWGTLAVNVLGCFVIELVVSAAGLSRLAVLALTTGVLGGFTTYSAFNHQTLTLARTGHWSTAAAYVGATLVGCTAAGVAGWAVGRLVWGR
jgi:fluoride exporter